MIGVRRVSLRPPASLVDLIDEEHFTRLKIGQCGG
jgi:hypothetical protein